jgi:hypothetical protein
MKRRCAHCTRTLLLPRQRQRLRHHPRIWRAPAIPLRESHQRRRHRAIFRRTESNQRRENWRRVFSRTRRTKGRRPNCSSGLFSARKRCCGGAGFTGVKVTASLDRIWNFRCAHFSRVWVFRPMAGSIWTRWLHSAYCRVSTGALRWRYRIGVSFLPRNRRCGANGFASRFRSELTAIRR